MVFRRELSGTLYTSGGFIDLGHLRDVFGGDATVPRGETSTTPRWTLFSTSSDDD